MVTLSQVILLLTLQLSDYAQTDAQNSVIVFYTTDTARNPDGPPIVYSNGRKLGEVTKGGAIHLVVSPGTYQFSLMEYATSAQQLTASIGSGQRIFLRVTRTAFFDGNAGEAGPPTVTTRLTSPPVTTSGMTPAPVLTKPAIAESTTPPVSAPAVSVPEPPQKPQEVAQPRPQRSTADRNPRSASESLPTPNPISASAPAASGAATNEDDVLASSYVQRGPRFGYGFVQIGPFTIDITNEVTASLRTAGPVFVDDGPQVGYILRAHYAPGLSDYQTGRYSDAIQQFTYVIDRPSYLNGHPNQAQYLSTAHYLRGMIFLYHADGVGRLTLAQQDFEAAIQWNPGNYLPYLELARVYVTVGFKEQASSVLQHLSDLKPEDTVIKEAQKILRDLASPQNPR